MAVLRVTTIIEQEYSTILNLLSKKRLDFRFRALAKALPPQYLMFSEWMGSPAVGTRALGGNELWDAFKEGSHESLIEGAAPEFKTHPILLPAGWGGAGSSGMVS